MLNNVWHDRFCNLMKWPCCAFPDREVHNFKTKEGKLVGSLQFYSWIWKKELVVLSVIYVSCIFFSPFETAINKCYKRTYFHHEVVLHSRTGHWSMYHVMLLCLYLMYMPNNVANVLFTMDLFCHFSQCTTRRWLHFT